MKFLVLFLCFFFSFLALSQDKKIIDHTKYNEWKKVEKQGVSSTGKYIIYEITPHRGDGYLYLHNTLTAQVDSFYRATNATISANENFLTYRLSPGFDTLRNCELKKVDKKKWPQDTLVILRLADYKEVKIPKIKSQQIAEAGDWLAYMVDSTYTQPKKAEFKAKGLFKKWKTKKYKKSEVKEPKISSEGNYLYTFNPITEQSQSFKNVTSYVLGDSSNYVFFSTQEKRDTKENMQLQVVDLSTKKTTTIDSSATKIAKITWNADRQILAYLSSSDTSKVKNVALNLFDIKDQKKYVTIDSNTVGVPAGQMPTENQSLIFTKDNRYLFFGITKAEVTEPEDSLLTNEKPVLDLWHYQDKRLQPEQLLRQKSDREKSNLFCLNLADFTLSQLENDSITTRVSRNIIGDYLLGTNVLPYQQTYNWTFPTLEDHYRINIATGETKLIANAIGMGGELSPSGQLYTYFDVEQQNHFLMNITDGSSICLSCSRTDVAWQTDVNGMPHTPYPFGIVGYNADETEVYIQSDFDVWSFDLINNELNSVTKEIGQAKKQKMRFRVWDRDSIYVSRENTYFAAQDVKTKDELIYTWGFESSDFQPSYRTSHSINSIIRAKDGSAFILRKANLQEYADVYLLSSNLSVEKRLSLANPQQKEYNWAHVELIDYVSRDGQKLQALLYTPENFDASKSYPLLVYFYELYTDDLHNHYAPRPTASIIYPTEYASAGYVVLIPDIRYKEGFPARGAFNCIMGATDAALKCYKNIDSTRMGLQGQSWGGYQTAQLITMTTRYAAAMAGAPVSNMFSAYGGIRWGSGLNRQFQYEKTQSRIGKTIWEAPALYTENSPLFHLPKVKTPLLIMHNDGDGSVPWYQGIELFTAMKRLGKPCWMLNYNGDDHNLLKNANRMDLSLRMRQFFDHYLLAAPAPRWLVDGIPATVKGKELRYELTGGLEK